MLFLLYSVNAVYCSKMNNNFNLFHTGPSDKHNFQAETQQLLDIVARSLYSEKEVHHFFIRLLVFNYSITFILSVLNILYIC